METWTGKELETIYKQEPEDARRFIRICRTVYAGLNNLSLIKVEELPEPRFIVDCQMKGKASFEAEPRAAIRINPEAIRAGWNPKATPEEIIEDLAEAIRPGAVEYWETATECRGIFAPVEEGAAGLTAAALGL